MSDAHADVSKHVKAYIAVFATLAVLTIITVWASTWHLSHPMAIAVALAIASVKATLVAMIFMHLKWEKAGNIWFVIVLTVFFFVVLVSIPALMHSDRPLGTVFSSWG